MFSHSVVGQNEVTNRTVNQKQQTICCHVNDMMASHMEEKVNEDLYKFCKERYGALKPVSITYKFYSHTNVKGFQKNP